VKFSNSFVLIIFTLLIFSSYNLKGIIGGIDPLYQWNLLDVGVDDSWSYTKGNSNITVAVIDSGVDFSHPDLIHQSWHNPGEIPNNEKDDDNNGYLDDTIGWDFRDGDNDPSPGHVHGTFISGLIAADDDNNLSVGVAPNVRIMAIRFLDDNLRWGPQDWPLFVEAIDYAIDNEADIIHLSLQAFGIPPTSFYDVIKRAYSNGIPIVSVTGNLFEGEDPSWVRYPGNYTEVIAVSSTNKSREISDFSCYGTENEICAPGEDIYSIEPASNSLTMSSGTSFAAPLVSGAIALMLSINENLSIEMIRHILHETSTDLGQTGKDNLYGFGLLNVSAALGYTVTHSMNTTTTSHYEPESSSTNNKTEFEFSVFMISLIITLFCKRKKEHEKS
jgi:subtilisin family serine protease